MAFQIAGVVVKKNYTDRTEELGDALGLDLVFDKEITWQDSIGKKKKGVYDVHCAPESTILLMDISSCLAYQREDFSQGPLAQEELFFFVYDEPSRSYFLHYIAQGKVVKSIIEAKGELVLDEGELEQEDVTDSTEDLVYYLIETNTEFFYMDEQEPMQRYKV